MIRSVRSKARLHSRTLCHLAGGCWVRFRIGRDSRKRLAHRLHHLTLFRSRFSWFWLVFESFERQPEAGANDFSAAVASAFHAFIRARHQ